MWLAIDAFLNLFVHLEIDVQWLVKLSLSVWWSSDLDGCVTPCNSNVSSNLSALQRDRKGSSLCHSQSRVCTHCLCRLNVNVKNTDS